MRALASLVAAAYLLAPSLARANPDLERGKKLLADLYFDEAAKAFTAALEKGDSGAADVVQIYLGLGEISASTGDRDKAIDHFERALALAPDSHLAKGSSPKVKEPFQEAQRFFSDKKPLAASLDIGEGDAVRVSLKVGSDPLDMLADAAVTYELEGGKSSSIELKIKGRSTLIPIPADAVALSVRALDRHGNHLVDIERTELPEGAHVEAPPPPAQPQRDEGGSFFGSPYLWGGLALALAGTGVGFGLASQTALDDLDDLKARSTEVEFADAQKLEDKAKQRALIANVAFAAAGASAIAAAVLLFTGSDDGGGGDGGSSEKAELVPALGPDYIGAAATVRF